MLRFLWCTLTLSHDNILNHAVEIRLCDLGIIWFFFSCLIFSPSYSTPGPPKVVFSQATLGGRGGGEAKELNKCEIVRWQRSLEIFEIQLLITFFFCLFVLSKFFPWNLQKSVLSPALQTCKSCLFLHPQTPQGRSFQASLGVGRKKKTGCRTSSGQLISKFTRSQLCFFQSVFCSLFIISNISFPPPPPKVGRSSRATSGGLGWRGIIKWVENVGKFQN